MTVTGKYVERTVSGNESNAEDSSYDSDYEAEDVSTSSVPLESQVPDSRHSDVSRTSSDTLAAEFAEYVTVEGSSATVHSPGYAARVEFALKLGYTERLVQTALEKLGPDPEQNELLAELIKLGAASCSQRYEETTEGYCETNGNEVNPGSGRLRSVVIDGSNVAMSHGNKEVFSCRGIKICVDWFRARGHKEITVFVPKWRKETSRIDNPVADQEILGELERDRLLVFTPSRLVGGKRMVCYDDRYILKLAVEVDGIVVSNDNYRDLAQENPEFRKVVEERILMYTFVNDRFMPPDDPLGRSGPTLDNFLRILPRKSDPAPPCPYAKKCTYGNKCKFRHPERGSHPQKSVTEKLVEHVQRHLQVNDISTRILNENSILRRFIYDTIITEVFQHQPLCKAKSAVNSTVKLPSPTVAKSKSVENVTIDQSQPLPTTSSRVVHRSPCWRTSRPETEAPNMHKKLQRQLTLNPVYDPRLLQLRDRQQSSRNGAASSTQGNESTARHRPLTRHSSHETPFASAPSCHQHLTRIASAPDSYQPVFRATATSLELASGSNQRSGGSETNRLLSPVCSQMSTEVLREFLDARSKIHYHLANIFPEEHVRNAMMMLPFETDAIEICLAILNTYPQS
ncbi:probable ribonuclease ZC3H12C isoform X2 [Ceratina calcarata]|uniref:Probable ribonuclease ZC3H12C isoform X2 n=1 Tax=Ceratina calcarata TaxID=156304 RepID=A0AAJ7SDP6_9HYME|nr:probable ribonuclease ZC3H12C isoform X2 [Ceratina calcarata]